MLVNKTLLQNYKKRRISILFLGPFLKNLLQSVTNSEIFKNFKIIITKCEKQIKFYEFQNYSYKVWQVGKSRGNFTDFTNLKTIITKCDMQRKFREFQNHCYKVWQVKKASRISKLLYRDVKDRESLTILFLEIIITKSDKQRKFDLV